MNILIKPESYARTLVDHFGYEHAAREFIEGNAFNDADPEYKNPPTPASWRYAVLAAIATMPKE